MTEVLEIQHRVHGLIRPLLSHNRVLLLDNVLNTVKDTTFSFGSSNTKKRRFYVFSDSILWTNENNEVKNQGLPIHFFSLTETENDNESKIENKDSPCLKLSWKKENMILFFNNQKEKDRWLNVFPRLLQSSTNERLVRRRASLDSGPLGPVFSAFYNHEYSPATPGVSPSPTSINNKF